MNWEGIVGFSHSVMALKDKWLSQAKGLIPQLKLGVTVDENLRVVELMLPSQKDMELGSWRGNLYWGRCKIDLLVVKINQWQWSINLGSYNKKYF